MRIQKRITYAITIAIIVLFAGMFGKITPCKTAPDVPNPDYQWSTCSLNPDTFNQQGLEKKYLGYTSSLRDAYISTIAISFIIVFASLHFIGRNNLE